MARPARPQVAVVGLGRLGGALARALKRAGWPVRVVTREPAKARALGLARADDTWLRSAALCFLCVPDGVLAEVAADVHPRLGRRTALLHCAGALPLDVLSAARGRTVGSFHPLCAVSSPRDALAGHAVALSTRSPALLRHLRRAAADVGLFPISIPEDRRAAYHAGAVLAAGHAVALLAAAVEALGVAGVREEDALRALLPLTRSALRGVEARGLAGGLTGPVPRGDAGVVRAHLAELPASVTDVYRPLALRALALAAPRLAPAARAALEDALRRG